MARAPRDETTPLTDREQAFVTAYADGGFTDPQAAGIAAGYAPSRVHVTVYEIMALPNVAKAIREAQERVRQIAEQHAGVTLAQVVAKLAQVGLFDPRRLFDKHHGLLPPDQWPDDIAAAVAGIEVFEEFDSGPDGERVQIGLTKKVKLLDRTKALDMLMKHLGGYEVDNKQRGTAGADAVAELVRVMQQVSGDACRLPIAASGGGVVEAEKAGG